MSTLSERIKKLRLEKDLTQEEFGKLFGIVKSTVSLYENGKSTPDDELKKNIAQYFNCTLDYLMGVSGTRNPYEIQTIAAHHDGDDWTEEELSDIEKFKEYVRTRRGN